MPEDRSTDLADPWLSAMWPLVRAHLPAPPARVLEVGCGALGGFVPALSAVGYDVVGIDPEAPEGALFRRVEIEQYDDATPADAAVASLSLHHVSDLGAALDRVVGSLKPGGIVVVLEWASEDLDEATARWCLARLAPEIEGERGWLRHLAGHRETSGLPWDVFLGSWREREGLHRGQDVMAALEARFETLMLTDGPYFFPELEISQDDEQAAIDAGQIRPGSRRYAGRRP